MIYRHDELGRLKTVTLDWLGASATYDYDADGRLDHTVNFNGVATGYEYDNAGRLTSLESAKTGGGIVAAYSVTDMDGNGNRRTVDRDEPLDPVWTPETVAYTYNNPRRNRLQTAGSTNFVYDDEGQLADKGGVSYGFDCRHRLKTVGSQTEFFYDGLGNRLKAVRNGVVNLYVYDATGNLIAEADASGEITRYYIHGAGLLATISAETDAIHCYHYDPNGNTVAITDESQNIANAYAYTPFGIIANKMESLAQPFTFVGEYGVMTESNGLFYMRARYYDSKVGRFIAEDLIGFAGGDVNLYAYVQNNPINWIDPDGLFGVPISAIKKSIKKGISGNWWSIAKRQAW